MALAAVSLLSVIACSSSDDGDVNTVPSAAQASPAATATAVPTVTSSVIDRVVIGTPPPTREGNNPGKELGPAATVQLRPMFEYLIGYDPNNGDLTPQLATSWSVEPDGMSLRFQLQEGAQFHNNNGEFGAQDVVYSLAQISAEDAEHSHSSRYQRVTPEVVNDHEIIFRLTKPQAELLQSISEQISALEIQSAADFEALGEAPSASTRPLAGTGAYQYVEREQGQSVLFERVPYEHWRYQPDFQELQFRWMNEASTRLAALLTEEIHLAGLPQDQMQQAISDGMAVATGPIAAQHNFMRFKGVYGDEDYARGNYVKQNTPCGFVHCDSPFLDVKVRKALNKAVDRDVINRSFLGNKGQTMVMNHIPPSHAASNPEWERNFPEAYGYDPQAARALLAEAGYGSDNPLEVVVELTTLPWYSASADVGEAVSGFWRDIDNIDISLISPDRAANNAETREFTFKNHMIFRNTSAHPVQSWRVYDSHILRGGNVELPELRPLNVLLQETMDSVRQVQLLRETGDTAYALYTNVFLHWVPAEVIYNPKFVESYGFPGSITDIYTHFDHLKAVKR